MARNLKILSLVLTTMLAIGAMSANAAMAAHYLSESSSGNTILEGNQLTTNELDFETGVLKCTSLTFTGTQEGNLVEFTTLHPTYSGCKLAGIAATVTTTGCNYILTWSSGTGPTKNQFTIECEAGKSIKITKESCTITIPLQNPLSNVRLSNNAGPPKTVSLTAEVTGIKYSESGGTCAKSGEQTNGTWTGSDELFGFVDNSGTKGPATGIFVK